MKYAPCSVLIVRKGARKVLEELEIMGEDRRDRRGDGLVAIAFGQEGLEARLRLRVPDECDPRWLAVGARRAELGEIHHLLEQAVRHLFVEEFVVRARGAEELVERGAVDR